MLSPELVLVSPDLRAAALAALPERDPDAFLVCERVEGKAQHRLQPLLVAKAAAYALLSLAQVLLLWGLVTVALTAVVTIVIPWLA